MAMAAGHDIDYIALAGALEPVGRAGERPIPALNLVGDFGGGGMLLAFGMLAAIISARQTGAGQVVDAAMVDGAASLMTMTYTLRASGIWNDVRGTNLLDTGAHFYEVYETSDDGFIAVGAIEPQFYAELVRRMGLENVDLSAQMDREKWPAMKERFAEVFATKTRKEWEAIFEGSDACAAPVLSPAEAPSHPHMQFRGTFTEVAGVVQPAPSPRFQGTPGSIRRLRD
jgi:alpha-methylacyl-CoA racemase